MNLRKLRFNTTIAGLLFACVTVAAQAATVDGVKTITITSSEPTWLQVSEVVAISGGVDVATTSALATASALSVDYAGVPDLAIDGLFPGECINNNNCDPLLANGLYHSGASGGNEFLTVVLDMPSDLTSLLIYGRTDGFSSRDIYDVELFNNVGASIFQASNLSADNPMHKAVAFAPVPIPAALPLFLSAIAGFGYAGWRRNRISA